MDIDKKINKLRTDILILETELHRMLYPKDERGEDFLPPGNEIPFNFKKTRYENMMHNIKVSIKDLKLMESKVEKIWEITNNK